ncbi:MAG: NosD domain-containing protein, partial [Candidatus Thorarchaeota archaeon]
GVDSTGVLGYSPPSGGIETLPIKTVIEQNTFVNCYYGFLSGFDGSNLFSNNTITDCRVGVSLGCTSGNRIVDNLIQDSTEYGVSIIDADQNRIYGNIITNSGIQNGLDEDGINFWDDGEGEGNSWSDFNGTSVYSIGGSSSSADRWPSRYGAPYISIVTEMEVISGTTGANITWSAFDSDPLSYSIIMNGTILKTETWDGTDIVFTLQGLEPGVYNLTTVVMDVLGLSAAASIFVTYTSENATLYIAIIGGIIGVVLVTLILFQRNPKKGF